MSNEYVVTLVTCFLLYISFWLGVDHSSQKFYRHTHRINFISTPLEKIIFPFRWYENRPTYEYVLGLVLLSAIVTIISAKLLSCFFGMPKVIFEFIYNLSKCAVLGVILAICIYYCFTVKVHPVKRTMFYLTGVVFIVLLIMTLTYPFIA